MKISRWSSRWPRWIRDPLWELRWRFDPSHRYHVVKTDLRPGYYDIDTLMLHACMKLLRRYIEDEHDGEVSFVTQIDELQADYDQALAAGELHRTATPEQLAMEREALAIWRWWMKERAPARRALEAMPFSTRAQLKASHEVEIALDAKDDEMLGRLLKIRRSLWT